MTTFYLTIQRFAPCAAGVAIAQNETNENDAETNELLDSCGFFVRNHLSSCLDGNIVLSRQPSVRFHAPPDGATKTLLLVKLCLLLLVSQRSVLVSCNNHY